MKASRHAAAACGVLVALGATCAIDLGVKTGPSESTAAGIPSSLENASPYHPDWSRVLKEDSVLTLPGLWSRALVDVELAASSALPKGQVITGLGNGIPLRTQDVGGREGILRFDGASDSRGRLRLTVKGQSQGAALRISSWRVVQERQPRVPRGVSFLRRDGCPGAASCPGSEPGECRILVCGIGFLARSSFSGSSPLPRARNMWT